MQITWEITFARSAEPTCTAQISVDAIFCNKPIVSMHLTRNSNIEKQCKKKKNLQIKWVIVCASLPQGILSEFYVPDNAISFLERKSLAETQ